MKLAVDIIAQAIRAANKDTGAGRLAEEILAALEAAGYNVVTDDSLDGG